MKDTSKYRYLRIHGKLYMSMRQIKNNSTSFSSWGIAYWDLNYFLKHAIFRIDIL